MFQGMEKLRCDPISVIKFCVCKFLVEKAKIQVPVCPGAVFSKKTYEKFAKLNLHVVCYASLRLRTFV